MNLLGNIFWFILGGFLTAVMYFIAGLLMCCTITLWLLKSVEAVFTGEDTTALLVCHIKLLTF